MDAQWQQFYWQHYLLQQQQQPTTQQSQPTHQYTPTGTYGPMTHSVRTQQAHQHHPYTPPPANSQPAHTPSPSTNQPFPPPPPPPLPTAAPTTPNATSFKHSPTQDSWHPTDSHWDSNALHNHQLHRTIQPTQWSRRVGIAGLPTFDVFPWLLAYHGTADYTARTLSHGKYCGLIPTRSIAESVFTTHRLQEIRDKRLDLDAIAEAIHTSQGLAVPNKTTQEKPFTPH